MAVDRTLVGSYISTNDFINDATGIQTTTLKPGVLARMILRASRRVDSKCNQTLYATLNTQPLQEDAYPVCYAIGSDGFLKVFPKEFPIQSIVSMTYNLQTSAAVTTIDPSLFLVQPRWIKVDGYWQNLSGRGMNLNLLYVAGWCISTTSAAQTAGQSTLAINPLPQVSYAPPDIVEPQLYGWRPGQILEVQDDVNTEVVTILSVSGNVITLTAPLANPHAVDTMVVDPAFANAQQATTLLTSKLIKSRGVGPLTLKNEAVRDERNARVDTEDEESMADDLLEDYKVYA